MKSILVDASEWYTYARGIVRTRNWATGWLAQVTVVVGRHVGVRPVMALGVGVLITFKEQHLSIYVACRLQLGSVAR